MTDRDGYIDVGAINLSSSLVETEKERQYWKLPAAIALLLIALTATIGTFAMRAQIQETNAEARCRSEFITSHELARSEFDELVVAQFLAAQSKDQNAIDEVRKRVEELYPRLQATREARAASSETCSEKGN